MNMRIGHGYDVHKLVSGRKLIIGGVDIPHELGLLGHSDADVLLHAVMDSILGALGMGDIGRHFPDTDKELQMRYFESQLELAKALDIPVVIHDRDAHGDIMEAVKRHKGVRGVFHSYSGGAEQAKELLSLGYIISFSGTLTFTNAKRPREVAAVLPRDSVLIETDCPYLAPHPKRGTLNHSGNLAYTNAALADVWGISPEECSEITNENARRFFSVK